MHDLHLMITLSWCLQCANVNFATNLWHLHTKNSYCTHCYWTDSIADIYEDYFVKSFNTVGFINFNYLSKVRIALSPNYLMYVTSCMTVSYGKEWAFSKVLMNSHFWTLNGIFHLFACLSKRGRSFWSWWLSSTELIYRSVQNDIIVHNVTVDSIVCLLLNHLWSIKIMEQEQFLVELQMLVELCHCSLLKCRCQQFVVNNHQGSTLDFLYSPNRSFNKQKHHEVQHDLRV